MPAVYIAQSADRGPAVWTVRDELNQSPGFMILQR